MPLKNLLTLNYYQSLLLGKVKFRSFLAIVVISVILSISPTIYVYKYLYPYSQSLETKVNSFIEDTYPQELEITIKEGKASTNVKEPYFITIQNNKLTDLFSVDNKEKSQATKKARILAIDTKGHSDQFESYQSAALLTESSLVYHSDGKINIYPLREVTNMVITKQNVLNQVNDFNKKYHFTDIAKTVILISPLFIIVGVFLAQIFYFLYASFLINLIAKIHDIPTSFGKVFGFTIALHFLPTILWNLLSYIPNSSRYLDSSIFLIFMLAASYTIIQTIQKNDPSDTDKDIYKHEGSIT